MRNPRGLRLVFGALVGALLLLLCGGFPAQASTPTFPGAAVHQEKASSHRPVLTLGAMAAGAAVAAHESLRNLNQQEQETLDGSPSTVRDAAGYVNIKFQCGPVQEHGVNGTSIENVIDLLVARLEGFQKGPFACRTNALAITNLQQARMWLEERTRERERRGVEGTNQV